MGSRGRRKAEHHRFDSTMPNQLFVACRYRTFPVHRSLPAQDSSAPRRLSKGRRQLPISAFSKISQSIVTGTSF
jgi:hypothetical protein